MSQERSNMEGDAPAATTASDEGVMRRLWLAAAVAVLCIVFAAVRLGSSWHTLGDAEAPDNAISPLTPLLDPARQFEAAEQQYLLSLEAEDRADTRTRYGNLLADAGRSEQAVEQYRKALELDPNYADAHNNLGISLAEQAAYGEAHQHFALASELAPENPTYRHNLGRSLVALGRVAEAIPHFMMVVETTPEAAPLAVHIAWLIATHEPIADASPVPTQGAAAMPAPALGVQLAEGAVAATGGKVPMILDVLAAAYAHAGDFDKAVATARRAAELAADHPELAGKITERLELYQAGKPYREKPAP